MKVQEKVIKNRLFNIIIFQWYFLILTANGQSHHILLNKEEISKKINKIFHKCNKTTNIKENEKDLFLLKRYANIKLHDTIKGKMLYLNGLYHYFFLRNINKADSIFKKAFEFAVKTNNHLLIGLIYNSRGVLYSDENKNSEQARKFFLKAIKAFKKINDNRKLLETYYNLTVNSIAFGHYDEAIKSSQKCLEIIDDDDLMNYYLRIYYYLAKSYFKLNKYEEAESYLKILKTNLIKSDYDNKTYTYYLMYKLNAEIQIFKKEYSVGIDNLNRSISLLKEINNKNLNSINKFQQKELSLEKKNRKEKETTIVEQNKILLISFSSTILLLLLISMLIFLFKRDKKKKFQISKLNEELNELIENLQQNNVDLDSCKQEKENLFRLNKRSLFIRMLEISNYKNNIVQINKDIDNYLSSSQDLSGYVTNIRKKLSKLVMEDELWKDFMLQFEKTRPEFFNKLKEVDANLSINDLRHCAYVVAKLKSKEVAELINVSIRSVESTRYRIKKKLGLEKEDSLYDLLSKF